MEKDYKKAIAQACRGDQAAFARLYEWSSRRVYYTSRELLGNDADAEDVTQETYLAAFSRLDELKNPAQFEAWVSRIAVNKSINLLKKNGRLVPLPEGSDSTAPEVGFPIYQFGNYHDATNWYVLAPDERGLLLLAENVVDVLPFDDDYATEEWAECSLREWLNTDFCEVAFSPDEMARILNIEGDKVFLLDYDEAYEYFAEAQQRIAYPSKYALQRAAER